MSNVIGWIKKRVCEGRSTEDEGVREFVLCVCLCVFVVRISQSIFSTVGRRERSRRGLSPSSSKTNKSSDKSYYGHE